MSLDLILGILRGVKVYDSDTKTWRVYDSQGNELADSSGILLQGLHGLLLRNAANAAVGKLYSKRKYVHIERDGEYLIFPSAALAAAWLEWEKSQKAGTKKAKKKLKPIKQSIRIKPAELDKYLAKQPEKVTVKELVKTGDYELLISLLNRLEQQMEDELVILLLAA